MYIYIYYMYMYIYVYLYTYIYMDGRWHQEHANHGLHSSHASQVLDLTCIVLKRLLVWPASTSPAHSALLEVRCLWCVCCIRLHRQQQWVDEVMAR